MGWSSDGWRRSLPSPVMPEGTEQGGLPGSPPPARLPMWHGRWAERPGWAGAGAGQGGGDSGAQLAGKPQPGLEFASESSIQK